MPATRILIFALSVCVILYLTALGALAVEQRELFYPPQGEALPPAEAGLDRAQVLLLTTIDGDTLWAWYVAPARGKPLFLYFHGQGGSLETPAAMLADLTASGSGLLAVEYRGYPGSTGSPSEDGLLRDADAAYREALSLGIPDKRLVAFGESLGCGVAVALAASHKVGAVILDLPYTSTVDVAAMRLWMFPVRLVTLDTFHSEQRMTKIAVPVLIVHGTGDQSIPCDFGRRLFALAREPKAFVTVPDGGHLPVGAVIPRVLQWITRMIPSA